MIFSLTTSGIIDYKLLNECNKIDIMITIKHKFLSFLTIVLCLSSCVVNHRNNYIIPGYYEGVDMCNETTSCFLTIKSITEEEYNVANGVDVVKDLINPGFYQLECYVQKAREERIKLSFFNLKDAKNGLKAEPIEYRDDNDSIFATQPSTQPSEKNKAYFKYFLNEDGEKLVIESFLIEGHFRG